MALPLLAVAVGGTALSLALQWYGQQQEYELQKRKLNEIERKLLKKQTEATRKAQMEVLLSILIWVVVGVVIYTILFKKKKR